MGSTLAYATTIHDLGKHLTEFQGSLPASVRSGVRIRERNNQIFLTVTKSSGVQVVVNSNVASFAGNRLPKFAIGVQRFDTTTEASSDKTRLIFAPKMHNGGVYRKKQSVRDEFSARVRKFFDTNVLSQVHDAALKAALKEPTEFETILHTLERPEVAASVRNQDPLTLARLRGIEAKRRILTGDGGLLSAEKAGEILTISRQAVEKRRKAGRLIGVSLGRRGFGYPAWQFTERGTLPHLETILDALAPHDSWTKLAFFTSENAMIGGRKPLDVLRSRDFEKVLIAAHAYGEQGAT